MTAPEHPAAPAIDRVLYQVVHVRDMDRDEWTQDYAKAQAVYARFVRDYGGAHLHTAVLHAGHYDAVCLQRFDSEGGATR
jgi:hypothetical protein